MRPRVADDKKRRRPQREDETRNFHLYNERRVCDPMCTYKGGNILAKPCLYRDVRFPMEPEERD